jgi:iron-sulfur cluster repair protein YtfE (RIC family)
MVKMNEKALEQLHVDYGERPSMEPLDGVTDQHRKAGSHLAAIHRMHLRDVYRIGQLLEKVKAGVENPSNLLQRISSASLTENMRTFGTLCGRECQVLTFHHNTEETSIFPQLEQQQIESLTLVVARLKEEHLIVHELLDRLQAAASLLVQQQSDANFGSTEAVFKQLTAVVKSHFGYEETELRDALGKFVHVI